MQPAYNRAQREWDSDLAMLAFDVSAKASCNNVPQVLLAPTAIGRISESGVF